MQKHYPNAEDITAPYDQAISVTKNDSADIAFTSRAIIVGADGNLAVIMKGDTAPVTIAVKAGVVYPLQVKRVMSTNTTATGIVALQ